MFPVNGARSAFPSDCKAEDKILIHPAEEDPSNFITYRLALPVGIDVQGRGNQNIAIFNLKDRADLVEIRRDRLARYKACKKMLSLPAGFNTLDEIKEARIFMAKANSVKAPFAAMIRENIKNGLI